MSMLPCRESKTGHLLIVSSLSGFVPLPGQTAYSATKFALRVRALCSLAHCVFPEKTGVTLHTCFKAQSESVLLD